MHGGLSPLGSVLKQPRRLVFRSRHNDRRSVGTDDRGFGLFLLLFLNFSSVSVFVSHAGNCAISRAAPPPVTLALSSCDVSAKQPGLAARFVHAEVFVGERRSYAATLRAVEQAELHQIWFVHFLDGVLFLAQRRGDCA